MVENRRHGFTDEELSIIADKLAAQLTPPESCLLTLEQQRAVIDLITTKKKVVRWTLYLVGAMVLWVVKDIYLYIINHLGWQN